jgi:small-conductance mechanosensitive channel
MIPYIVKIISTLLLFLFVPVTRLIVRKLTWKYADMNSFNKHRTKMMLKYIYITINLAAVIILIIIWGVDPQNILVTLSSIFAIIGVAMFAQWSILSNVTAGIIIFFTMQIKIGDKIEIHDKDFPIVAEIADIKAFHICLRSFNGEKILYPNNLLLQKGITIHSTH